jgi:hypothetical protein
MKLGCDSGKRSETTMHADLAMNDADNHTSLVETMATITPIWSWAT